MKSWPRSVEKEAMSSRPDPPAAGPTARPAARCRQRGVRLKGYHAAAMDDIADAAGVSKPVLYQHFPSKLDLYLALLDQSCDRLVDVVGEALASTDDNADRVIATVAAFYEFVSSTGGEFRFVFESDLTGDGAVQRRLSRVNDEISDAIAEVIAEDTALPPQQAKLLAVSLVGIAQVSARYWISGGNLGDHPRRSKASGQQFGLARHQRLPIGRTRAPHNSALVVSAPAKVRVCTAARMVRLPTSQSRQTRGVRLHRSRWANVRGRHVSCADCSGRGGEAERAPTCRTRERERLHTRRERRPRSRSCRRLARQAGLVLTIRTRCVAEPHTISTIGNHDGRSLIIPERVHDRGRLRLP